MLEAVKLSAWIGSPQLAQPHTAIIKDTEKALDEECGTIIIGISGSTLMMGSSRELRIEIIIYVEAAKVYSVIKLWGVTT